MIRIGANGETVGVRSPAPAAGTGSCCRGVDASCAADACRRRNACRAARRAPCRVRAKASAPAWPRPRRRSRTPSVSKDRTVA